MIKRVRKLLFLSLIFAFVFSSLYFADAHNVELDPESLITMPSMIFSGKGTITISSKVTNYSLYYQAVKMDDSAYQSVLSTTENGKKEIASLDDELTKLKNELDNLREAYDTKKKEYDSKVNDQSISDQEKQKMAEDLKDEMDNYNKKVNNYNEKIKSRNNRVQEINNSIYGLTPSYVDSNWTETKDRSFTIDRSTFAKQQAIVVWAKLVTSDNNTYYDETIYVIDGTQAEKVDVTGVSLDKKNLSLSVGSSYTLTATITPSNATNKTVVWESNNESVASVVNGKVTGKGIGTATITATTEDGNHTASCFVTVTSSGENPNESPNENPAPSTNPSNTPKDPTVANNDLPFAGENKVFILFIVLSAIGIVFYIKYKNIDK